MRAEYTRVVMPPTSSWQHRVLRQPRFDFWWHFHPEIELTLITRGSGTRIVGDRVESYRRGDLALIGAQVPHAYVSAPGSPDQEAILIQFRRDFLGTELFEAPELAGVARMLDASASIVEARPALADRFAALAGLDPAARTLALLDLLLVLADEPVRTLTDPGPPYGWTPAARRRMEVVCAHLQANFATDIRLDSVARVAHLSPTALSRFFRRAMGRTMTQYLTELRIAAACQLLRDTDLAVSEIATRCGYGNLSNFNRRFRAQMGQSPREYRRTVVDSSQSTSSPGNDSVTRRRRPDGPRSMTG